MPRLSTSRLKGLYRLKPSAFITQHAELVTARLNGPIADVACGSGRNLLPFLRSEQSVDCFDIRSESLDPYVIAKGGCHLAQHKIDLISDNFQLHPGKYGLILLVHFYAPSVLIKIIQALKPGGLLLLETIDNRGGNYHQLPTIGEVFKLITPFVRILSCQAKPAGVASNRQVIKLLGERLGNDTFYKADSGKS